MGKLRKLGKGAWIRNDGYMLLQLLHLYLIGTFKGFYFEETFHNSQMEKISLINSTVSVASIHWIDAKYINTQVCQFSIFGAF